MQKIEKWRVEELALVLNELAVLLRAGDSSEWASVFLHFLEEAEKIISRKEFDSEAIEKLARNILNCFDRNSSFLNISLKNENPKEEQKLNQALLLTRARLLNVLNDIQKRIIEHIH
jgi:molecular chaperone GrpE (heat shock protein)